MSSLINFNILIGILLGPTNLLESNEDMIFSISDLPVGLIKLKWLLNIFTIANGLEKVAPSTE